MEQNLLGKRIREERKKHNLTQEQLAELLSVSTTYIGYVERGERNLTLPKLTQLAAILGVTIEELMSSPAAMTPSAKEQKLLKLFSTATDTQKDLILSMAQLITEHPLH